MIGILTSNGAMGSRVATTTATVPHATTTHATAHMPQTYQGRHATQYENVVNGRLTNASSSYQ